MKHFRSLQARLGIRLALVYAAFLALALGLLSYRAYDSAIALNNRELRTRAGDLARSVSVDPSGAPMLALPPNLSAAYAASGGTDLFAIRARDGKVIAASPAAFGAHVATWPAATEEPDWFRLDDFGVRGQEYYGLNVAFQTAAGPLSVTVAQINGAQALVDSLIADFLFETAWIFPLLLALSVVIAVVVIRAGLQPIRRVSEQAAAIGPGTTSIRLPEEDLPSEVAPLVLSMNRALDRLERGMTVQRQFVDNAAHELRTPLAILTAALEGMGERENVQKLRGDVARMNHLVARLLSVARLDAANLDVSGTVDLSAIAASVVSAMAPLAIAQKRTLALVGAERPVFVRGEEHAIEDAVRNLVENAICYSPVGGEVVVGLHADGGVSVADRGAGVRPDDRERIFQRFWRGDRARTGGAGLGLSIVKEIMRAHQGTVVVDDNPGGGAVFKLCFAR